jgi:hypothetical protein
MPVEAVGANQAAVTGAIRTAARATGVNFNYLLATAKVESDLDPNLTMRSSTATGLFQFLDQTWLETLKQAGPAFGYGNYAAAISKTASGNYQVTNPAMRREIMQLRKDPTANALMGGAFTQQNRAVLSQRIGHTPSEGELYIGHFFGPYTGARAINLAASNPTADAAAMFPAAARANRSIFYDRQGNARGIAGVCTELVRRYHVARAGGAGPDVQLAAAPLRPPAPIPNAAAPAPFKVAPSDVVFAPPPAVSATAYADDNTSVVASQASQLPPEITAVPRAERGGGVFRSLFQVDGRSEPLSPLVTSLWSSQAPAPDQTQGSTAPPATPVPAPLPANPAGLLDLFRDLGIAAPKRHDGKA